MSLRPVAAKLADLQDLKTALKNAKPGSPEARKLSDQIVDAEAELKERGGRVLLRYSGTEPKARLLLEGPDRATLQKWAQRISDAIRKQLGG